MFRVSISTLVVLAVHMLLSEVAFAAQTSIQRGIQIRSWTDDTPVNGWMKDELSLITFTDSVSKILTTDEEFSNLQEIKVTALQEGDSSDEVLMRFVAIDKRWKNTGLITFDAEVRAFQSGAVGALTITAWASATGEFNTNGPRYDLPRAIVIPKN